MEYIAHYFERLTDTLQVTRSVPVHGESVLEARATAAALLPAIPEALGFRMCDRMDRQVDIYVPADAIRPEG